MVGDQVRAARARGEGECFLEPGGHGRGVRGCRGIVAEEVKDRWEGLRECADENVGKKGGDEEEMEGEESEGEG